MPSIALIHSGKSFMPELTAYKDNFESLGIEVCILVHPTQAAMERYDLLWFFMGLEYWLNEKNSRKIIIHEYCSASTSPFASLKDLVKKSINRKPNVRISLAVEHRGRVFPKDDIPAIFRKQGVHSSFFEKIVISKEYDFIYTGSALKIRKTDDWLYAFTKTFPEKKILLIGNHDTHIKKVFRSYSNIQFMPPVHVTQLPTFLAKSQFAVNYVPDVYPFNIQPSTKLLEYCAAGCKIISNSYKWVNEFCQQKKAGLFFIDCSFENLSAENINEFGYASPDMSEYRWEVIINGMELTRFLKFETPS